MKYQMYFKQVCEQTCQICLFAKLICEKHFTTFFYNLNVIAYG
jgi:hypothetical protein